jgi:adenylate kinase
VVILFYFSKITTIGSMHYYVVGVNGVGKSSLLQAISARTGIEVIHGTIELMHYLDIPGDYAALRAMDQDQVLVKWGETAKQLVAKYSAKPFLLDTHILNLTNGKIIHRDGPWIQKYDALVLVKASAQTIFDRISRDEKDRALFAKGQDNEAKIVTLAAYQDLTERLFNELASRYCLPSCILNNNDSLDKAVDAFSAFDGQLQKQLT